MDYRVISADSHIAEPDLWQERVERRYRDRAPRLVRQPDQDVFVCDGLQDQGAGAMASAGRKAHELAAMTRFEHNIRGGYDTDARLEDLAIDGVDAEVLYPTYATQLYALEDIELQHASFKAYNDWIVEFAGTHPDRYRAVGLVGLGDVELATQEIYRMRDIGLAGAMIAIIPDEIRPYSDPYYEPFWQAAAETRLPVSMHVLAWVKKKRDAFGVGYPTLPVWVQRSVAAMIFAGVFERHPDLTMISAESDVSWAANFMERMDHAVRRHPHRFPAKLAELPSAYFRRNVVCTFMDDPADPRLYDIIGAQCIAWSNDYPHFDGTWPQSQEVIERNFAGVPEEPRRAMLAGNAARLYGFG